MISCQNLVKHYGDLLAVKGLTFEVSPGEVVGFLGPNGAGKSTTMRIIAGFLPASSGRVTVCGLDIERNAIAAKKRIGYLPEGAPSYPEMTPRSFLEFVSDIRGLRGSQRSRRLSQVYEQLNIGHVLEQQIDTLSKGYKRRVGLAQAIIHDPEVLILDEPTDGLDPNQKHEVRELINDMARSKIIVISTHILEEVDAVCNRAIIIADGSILADATPQALEARSRFHNAVSIRFHDATQLAARSRELNGLAEVAETIVDEQSHRVTALPVKDRAAAAFQAINNLAQAGAWQVSEIHLESGRLDEVFRTITTRAGTAGGSGVSEEATAQ